MRIVRPKIGVVRPVLSRSEFDMYENLKSHIRYIVPEVDRKLQESTKHSLLSANFSSVLFSKTVSKWSSMYFSKLGSIECLHDLDIVFGTEIYTSLSAQLAKLSSKYKFKFSCAVFETIPYNPVILALLYNVKEVKQKTSLFIAWTNKAKDFLIKHGIPSERIKVVYPGVDLSKFKPERECNRSSNNKIKILFVGRLVKQKGITTLLQAFANVSKLHSDVELWIVGKGPLDNYVKKYSKFYPIKYLGFVDRDELSQIYKECDIFCLPSQDRRIAGLKVWEEQFGFVAVEAMASGLPVVSTNCGALPEVLGDSNIIIPQRSPKQLSMQLSRLICDDELRYKIGNSNRERAEELFDSKRQAHKLEEVFKYEIGG